jgi:hypothetical protein
MTIKDIIEPRVGRGYKGSVFIPFPAIPTAGKEVAL